MAARVGGVDKGTGVYGRVGDERASEPQKAVPIPPVGWSLLVTASTAAAAAAAAPAAQSRQKQARVAVRCAALRYGTYSQGRT